MLSRSLATYGHARPLLRHRCTLSLGRASFICSRVGGYATLPGSKDEVVTSRLDPVPGLPQRTRSGSAGCGAAAAPPLVAAAGHHFGGARRPIKLIFLRFPQFTLSLFVHHSFRYIYSSLSPHTPEHYQYV